MAAFSPARTRPVKYTAQWAVDDQGCLLTFWIPYNIVRNSLLGKAQMAAATLTSKGQITIPAAVRAELGLDTGSRVEFVKIAEGQYAMVPATLPVQALKGMFRKRGSAPTLEQMNQAIAKRGALAR